jgi:ribonuclease T1
VPQPPLARARGQLRRRPLLALVVLVLLLVVGYAVQGVHHHNATPPSVSLTSLPVQAQQTVALIQRHGPYPYREDGEVYDNLGRQLPTEKLGYYHEYTVSTPGSDDRGERRIITGSAGEFFYTADHYVTFRRVQVGG